MAEQPKVTKEAIIEICNGVIEEREWKLKKNANRLSPKEKRHQQENLDFFKSIKYHLEN